MSWEEKNANFLWQILSSQTNANYFLHIANQRHLDQTVASENVSTSNDRIHSPRLLINLVVVSRAVVAVDGEPGNVEDTRSRFRGLRHRARCLLQEVYAETRQRVGSERMVHEHVERYCRRSLGRRKVSSRRDETVASSHRQSSVADRQGGISQREGNLAAVVLGF